MTTAMSIPGNAESLPVPSESRRLRWAGLGFLLFGALCIVATLFLYRDTIIGRICNDGWISDATGAGACSSHEGVQEDIEDRTLLGRSPDSWTNVSRLGVGVSGIIGLGAGTALLRLSARSRSRALSKSATAVGSIGDRDAGLNVGIVELTAQIGEGGAGRVVRTSVDGGIVTTTPFFFRNEEGRAGPRLAELMSRTPKRRFGRRGRPAIETFGAELFDALLPEPARGRYREALAVALQTNARLRVLLDLDEPTADLPWEYLYDPERASFLAMSQDTSLFRLVSDGRATRSSAPIDRLRVLVMAASPRGLEPLDVAAERRRLGARLAGLAGQVDVNHVDGETFEDLRIALGNHDPHVFHFVGHGIWDDESEDGAVAFADDQGRRQAVSGRELGVLLNRPGLRLVLFNSCDAARTSKEDRFAGVAGSLVAQGVPAAIGMQYAIEDRSAAAFGGEFLAALIESHSVDEALTEARTAVYTSRSEVEWGTPVFTSRVPIDEVIPWASG